MAERTAVADTVARACTAGAGTVQALAEEVGVSYAALCSWSRGRRQPPAHRLRSLADVLDDRSNRLRELARELRAHAGDDRQAPAPERPLRTGTVPIGLEPPARSAWAAAGRDERTIPLSAR